MSDKPPEPALESQLIAEACAQHGADHIDLSKTFHQDWLVHHQRFDYAHNFHWNAYAFEVIAKRLDTYLSRHGI